MKKYGIILLILIFSCSKNPETLLTHLNGYWEIEEVTLENGTKKQYQFSETIDYISINDSLKGYRKKLKPSINDTYFTSDDAEAITLKIEDNQLNIYYKTAYAEWKETVLEASEKHLKVSNENNTIYLYKRYTPIRLDVEE
ncbi:lipocalin family protein [Winogradskyella marincola]|uniref:Lipocalin family protein n=1 Tax=Winogradskyella marincola TaxID=3037795 RepID=A0ABT6G2N2_9FLAO|nr:lipocalin family protein [Winogradskyella sp. YYF002]MDG4716299.1 lipocalin family protein [Winogradskyella sp. YYF002]